MKINRLVTGPGTDGGYTLRCATDALSPYDGVNLCHYTNDAPKHVAECSREFARMLGVPADALVIPRQTHSSNVAVIDGAGPHAIENVDALVTDRRDIVLCINTADCVPVLLSDPHAGVIGACHAGWRGAVNGVIENTIQAMLQLGATAENIHVAMGPCICPSCFEVGHEVAERFSHWHSAVVTSPFWHKPHVDLPAAISVILSHQGITRIEMPPECTRCCWTDLFSARKLGINSGRMLTFIRRL